MSSTNVLDDQAIFELYPDIVISRDNIAHYRGLAQSQLLINRCGDCGQWIYPHRPLCPDCWSWNVAPQEVSGRGRLHMFTLINQVRDPAAGLHEPIVAAAIELEEQAGLRYLARIVDCAPSRLAHDMPVTLTWIEDGGKHWPAFAPAGEP